MRRINSTAELSELLRTYDSIFEPPLSEDISDFEKYAEKLILNAETYVMEENNIDLGFISFYANDEEEEHSFIVLLAVLPEFRGRRVAQELLDRCMFESINKNKKGVKLEVIKENNSAIRFYERNNFTMTGETNRGSVYMTRTPL